MLVHNLARLPPKVPKGTCRSGAVELGEPPVGRALYLRMTLSERLQHGALAPELHAARPHRVHAPLSRGLVGPGPPAVQPRTAVRRCAAWLHRISGVVMVAASVLSRRSTCPHRRGPRVPPGHPAVARQDLRDAIATRSATTLGLLAGAARGSAASATSRRASTGRSSGARSSWPSTGIDHVVRQHVHRGS